MKLTVVYARDSSEWQNDQSIKGQLNMLLDNEHVPLVGPHLDGWANVIFQPLCKPIYVFHKSSKTGNFFQMAPWRVLGIDECGGASRRHSQAHATEKQQDWHEKPKRKHGGAEPSPLTRLGIGSVFPAAHSFLSLVLYPFYIEDIEQIVLDDIRSKARLVLEDEDKARTDFLKHKEQMSAAQYKSDSKALTQKTKRYEELERLMQSVYEDKVIGKIPEEICLKLLAKYTEEQNALKSEIDELENKLSVVTKNESDVDEFICRLKHYANVPELTRELCLELIEYITIGAKPGDKTGTREIHIYYKLLGNQA